MVFNVDEQLSVSSLSVNLYHDTLRVFSNPVQPPEVRSCKDRVAPTCYMPAALRSLFLSYKICAYLGSQDVL
jgi:hypothetical protein